ncbi:MAG: immunoglobulin domain-containing protein [Candidatus Synoicihabitans palmerolidicus]|nr:immunoglobulin domain-containing protein [Candidatus Synoicihabitans palmerolidicus]
MRITEFDITGDDETVQADYLRDFYTLAFSHPKMIGVQMWGFWEEAHWRAEAALYASDWTERAVGTAYRELLQETWKTNEMRTTGPDGRIRGRGFQGTYEVEDEDGTLLGSFSIQPGSDSEVSFAMGSIQAPEPQIVLHPLGTTVEAGSTVTLVTEAAGSPAPSVAWYREGGNLVGSGSTLTLSNVTEVDAGQYYAKATSSLGEVTSRWARVGVRASTAAAAEKLSNISTRGRVNAGSEVMVVSFVIKGTVPKEVMVRAVGPRLGEFGMPGVLDPYIKLLRVGESTPLAEVNDWAPELAAEFGRLGAFDMGADTKSAAMQVSLDPGVYVVQIEGVGGSTGVAIAEVYDAATGSPVELTNLSTRGFVGAGTDIMVARLVVDGLVPQKVLIRGIGPALESFGVTGTLPDPVVRLYQSLPGGGARFLAQNYDWSAAENVDALRSASKAWSFPVTREVIEGQRCNFELNHLDDFRSVSVG